MTILERIQDVIDEPLIDDHQRVAIIAILLDETKQSGNDAHG